MAVDWLTTYHTAQVVDVVHGRTRVRLSVEAGDQLRLHSDGSYTHEQSDYVSLFSAAGKLVRRRRKLGFPLGPDGTVGGACLGMLRFTSGTAGAV